MGVGLLLLAGVGVWLLAEGLIYAAAPDLLRRLAALLESMSAEDIRAAGLWSAALGGIVIYVAFRLS